MPGTATDDRRRFLKRAGMAAIGGTASLAWPQNALGGETPASGKPPNVIVILADDLGYGDLGCYGNPRIKTPCLDALAAGGVRFTDFHSSGAVCSPTRAGLLTGRYQQRAGIAGVLTAKGHRDQGLAPDEITFAERSRAAGYTTAIFGKWHLGYDPRFHPDKLGFDRFRGYVSGNIDYISHIDQTGVADWWDNGKAIAEDGYVTHLITKHAVDFIEANKDRPFCLCVAHEAPHYPYQGPNDRADRAIGKTGVPHLGTRQDRAAAYVEMIAEMDQGIGRIIETVERLGQTNRTFVFFFSDNGATGPGSNGNLRGKKGTVWEGGHRVPAIAYWPGRIAPGQTTDELSISLDLFATLLALAGATVPAGHRIDGTNLVPLLIEGKGLGERTLFWAHARQRAVRQGPWKMVTDAKGGERTAPLLFHLAQDLGEKQNRALEHPERVRSMLAALDAWEKEVTPEKRDR